MTEMKVYAFPNLVTPQQPVQFNEKTCIGCNRCIDMCQMDVLMPNPEKGRPPIVLYPDECWMCGCCVKECPLREREAVVMNWPVLLRMRWKDKKTGEHFRYGMPNPPPPNTRPPVGGWGKTPSKRKRK